MILLKVFQTSCAHSPENSSLAAEFYFPTFMVICIISKGNLVHLQHLCLILINLNQEAAREAPKCNLDFGIHLSIYLKTRKTKKTCIETASGRTFRWHTDFYATVRQAESPDLCALAQIAI